jgi:ParB-like chromosome segregation protein Spo0J
LEPAVSPVWVPVRDLVLEPSFRENGLCPEHVERLVALGGSWPPIVVTRTGRLVVDGAHRVAAARRLGLARLEAVLFDGSRDDVFIEFVRRNITHGLLLTLAERKRAAIRVLRVHPRWSDRRVAELCGLSPKTVGRIRVGAADCPNEESLQLDSDVRVGRDDRVRPVNRGSIRVRVVEALRAQPNASLRTIAALVGVSPETVRLVRMNLAERSAPVEAEPPADASSDWRADAALSSCEQAEEFLAWFEQTAVTEHEITRAGAVPLSRVYELADEARRRSEIWLQLARALEARAAKAGG